jgi:hypothetical protein
MNGEDLPGRENIFIVVDLAETELSMMSEIAVKGRCPRPLDERD